MKKLAISVLVLLAIAIAQSVVVANTLSKDVAGRIEAIPIQTLTISDQQFLNGDLSGRPTTIAGTLRVAQGSGRLPLVILCTVRVVLRRTPIYGKGSLDCWVYPHLHLT